jgi:hypothetical protein
MAPGSGLTSRLTPRALRHHYVRRPLRWSPEMLRECETSGGGYRPLKAGMYRSISCDDICKSC